METDIHELELDIAELEDFIELTNRTNVKRTLENVTLTLKRLKNQLEAQKLLLKKNKESINNLTNTNTNLKKPKKKVIKKDKGNKVSNELNDYTSINNFTFENTDKFAK